MPELKLRPTYRLPASIVEYRRAPESKPLRRQADTRRASASAPPLAQLGFGGTSPPSLRMIRLGACTSYPVFKEPARTPVSSASKRTLTPAWWRSQNRLLHRVQGNLPTLLSQPPAVNPLIGRRALSVLRRASPQQVLSLGRGQSWQSSRPPGVESFRLGVRLGSPEKPGTWGHPPLPNGSQAFDERRRRNLILRAEGGLVNPRPPLLEGYITTLSGGAEPRRISRNDCLTYGRPMVARSIKSTTSTLESQFGELRAA